MNTTKNSTVTFGNGDPFVVVPDWDTEKQKEIEELLGSNRVETGINCPEVTSARIMDFSKREFDSFSFPLRFETVNGDKLDNPSCTWVDLDTGEMLIACGVENGEIKKAKWNYKQRLRCFDQKGVEILPIDGLPKLEPSNTIVMPDRVDFNPLTYIEDYPKSAGFYFIIGVKDDGQIDGPEVAENKMTNIGWFLYGSEIAYSDKYDKLFYAGPITTPELPKI